MLYIVATPIGNLEDISLRALRILSEVDFVLCEDTRVTRKLLNHYKLNTKTIAYHQHSNEQSLKNILELLAEGKNLALVSDAGTPGISDPGGKLVEAVIERFDNKIKVESIPGPSAVTAALSISGIQTDRFLFMGFLPHKKGRQTFIQNIVNSVFTVVVYESKHRILKFLEELSVANVDIEEKNKEIREKMKYDRKLKDQLRPLITSVVVCRELSKMHETVYRGELEEITERIKMNAMDQKGEFVVIIGR